MKHRKLSLALLSLLTLNQAIALDLRVVKNYALAEDTSVWNKSKADKVPDALLAQEDVSSPTYAYAKAFPKTFMQEELFVVCHGECEQKEILKINANEITNGQDADVLEQMNVYYWMTNYFKFLETHLNFQPQKHLKVMTDRIVEDPTGGSKLKNNAFFNPQDYSLTFLPASKSIFFKLLQGKVNRSGFDPSVIAHESSHYLFEQLYSNHVNAEIAGLNEGFADYVANTFIDHPKVGLVMLQGKVIRDSSNPLTTQGKIKSYAPKLEAHDLGEQVAFALWSIRNLATDKVMMDRAVIETVVDLNDSPYNTIHDFKEKLISRVSLLLDNSSLNQAKAILELVIPGTSNKVNDLSFIDEQHTDGVQLGFTNKITIPKEIAGKNGMPESTVSSYGLVKTIDLGNSQIATLVISGTTPHWVVVDKARSNLMGVYTQDKKLIRDAGEVKKLDSLMSDANDLSTFLPDFKKQIQDLLDLKNGIGDDRLVYKVKKVKNGTQEVTMNGETLTAHTTEVTLKRRILGALMGATSIDSITFITLPVKGLETPVLNNEQVIGYRLHLDGDLIQEQIIDQFQE